MQAVLASVPEGSTIIDGDVLAGSIDAGATVTPDDTIIVRIERNIAFQSSGLAWTFSANAGIALDPVRPAQVVVLSLAELGFTDGADSVKASGAVTDVLLQDGSLRFSTPGDTGVDQHAQFFLSKGNSVTTLDLLIQTELPTAVETYMEPDDDGNVPATAPVLAITGLGPNNRLQATALEFRLMGAAPRPCRTTAMACCRRRVALPSASSSIGSSMRPATVSASAPRHAADADTPAQRHLRDKPQFRFAGR